MAGAKLVLTESMVEIPSSYHRFGSPWRIAGNTLTDAAGRHMLTSAVLRQPVLEVLLLLLHLKQNDKTLLVSDHF